MEGGEVDQSSSELCARAHVCCVHLEEIVDLGKKQCTRVDVGLTRSNTGEKGVWLELFSGETRVGL